MTPFCYLKPGEDCFFQRSIYGARTFFEELLYGARTFFEEVLYGAETYFGWLFYGAKTFFEADNSSEPAPYTNKFWQPPNTYLIITFE